MGETTQQDSTRSKTLKFRLSPAELEFLRTHAKDMGVDMSDYIRLAVKDFAKPKSLNY